jgi:hypothetical protein
MAMGGQHVNAPREIQFIPAKNLVEIKVEKNALESLDVERIKRIVVPKGIDIEFCGEIFHGTLTVALVDSNGKVIEEQQIFCFDDEFISRINTMGLKAKGKGGKITTRKLIIHKRERRKWKKEKDKSFSFISRLIG